MASRGFGFWFSTKLGLNIEKYKRKIITTGSCGCFQIWLMFFFYQSYHHITMYTRSGKGLSGKDQGPIAWFHTAQLYSKNERSVDLWGSRGKRTATGRGVDGRAGI